MEVELVVTNRVLDLVVDGIDLAIRAGPLKDSSLIAKRFDLGDFGLWASPDYLSAARAAPSQRTSAAQLPALLEIQGRWFSPHPWQRKLPRRGLRPTGGGRLRNSRSLAILGEGIAFCRVFSARRKRSKTNSPACCPNGAATKFPCRSFTPPNDSSRPKSARLSPWRKSCGRNDRLTNGLNRFGSSFHAPAVDETTGVISNSEKSFSTTRIGIPLCSMTNNGFQCRMTLSP